MSQESLHLQSASFETPGGNFTFGDAQGLFRFFGDINGDRHVDIADFALFSSSFNLSTGQTGFLAAFGAGPGGAPVVNQWQPDNFNMLQLTRSIFAFDPSFTGGVFVG